jgi:hypothetical protein
VWPSNVSDYPAVGRVLMEAVCPDRALSSHCHLVSRAIFGSPRFGSP